MPGWQKQIIYEVGRKLLPRMKALAEARKSTASDGTPNRGGGGSDDGEDGNRLWKLLTVFLYVGLFAAAYYGVSKGVYNINIPNIPTGDTASLIGSLLECYRLEGMAFEDLLLRYKHLKSEINPEWSASLDSEIRNAVASHQNTPFRILFKHFKRDVISYVWVHGEYGKIPVDVNVVHLLRRMNVYFNDV